jgi:RNA polymerase primary sigma factor
MKRRPYVAHPFLAMMSGGCRITDAQLHALARRVKAGASADGTLSPDAVAARNAIVEANLPLAYRWAVDSRAVVLDFDVILESALLGLVLAAERYDPDKLSAKGEPFRFSTYASRWIMSAIQDATEGDSLVRIPRYLIAPLRRLDADIRAGRLPAGLLCDLPAIADWLGVSLAVAESVVAAYRTDKAEWHSESIRPRGREDDAPLCDPPDSRGDDPGMSSVRSEQVSVMLAAIDRLPARQAEAIRLRFGLGGGGPLTQREVADAMGICRDRAMELERSGLANLRRILGGKVPVYLGNGSKLYKPMIQFAG